MRTADRSIRTLRPHTRGWAIRHPLATVSFLLGDKQRLHRTIVVGGARFLLQESFDEQRWRMALAEAGGRDFIPMRSGEDGRNPSGNTLQTTLGKWLYCVVRATRPDTMIETGVASGVSSWVILNAMHRNGRGQLFSLDLPNSDTNRNYLVGAREPGWAVPDALRERWSLRLGCARELLPPLLQSLERVDLFFHDSDHSYEHMTFEFESVLPFMRPGGLIVSDDIQKNEAFAEFTGSRRLRSVVFTKGGCAVVRRD
jgi:predicted O-methyltransferase YrrM